MADINKYLDGLNMKFSNQEKQLLDIFAEWQNVGITATRTVVTGANICKAMSG